MLLVTTFLLSFVSGLVPLVNTEAYLLSVSALWPASKTLAVAAAATLGQMAAKCLLYLAGGGLLRLHLRGSWAGFTTLAERLGRSRSGTALVFTSAVTGLPPFYAMSVAAGLLRFPFGWFLAAGLAGRLIRFGAVFLLPRLL